MQSVVKCNWRKARQQSIATVCPLPAFIRRFSAASEGSPPHLQCSARIESHFCLLLVRFCCGRSSIVQSHKNKKRTQQRERVLSLLPKATMAEEDSRKAARLTSPTGGTMKGIFPRAACFLVEMFLKRSNCPRPCAVALRGG